MFHEGEKQSLSKTLVRHELFCTFQVGMLQQFLVLISLGKFLLRRGLCWGRNKIIRLTINKRGGIWVSCPWFWFSSFISKEFSSCRQWNCWPQTTILLMQVQTVACLFAHGSRENSGDMKAAVCRNWRQQLCYGLQRKQVTSTQLILKSVGRTL